MPARSTPPPRGTNTPPNDVATYRDLLLFEERLKSNAKNLQSRKSRYQLFLLQLLLVISFLLAEVLLPPQVSLLAIPYRMALRRLLPQTYTPDVHVTVHPYFSTGMLFVSVTTLVLFFASGMYSEKIAYANKYVPHANRALRSFNMYLNVRKPSLRSKFRLNPLAFFFPRPADPPPPRTRPTRSPSAPGTSLPIPEIPPSTNPRGELIFSSRVDRAFRDGYERHRAAFERRREEKERERRRRESWWRFFDWRRRRKGNEQSAPAGGVPSANSPPLRAGSSTASSRKTDSRSGTPPPTTGIAMKQRERGRSPGTDLEGGREGRTMRTYALERNIAQRSPSR